MLGLMQQRPLLLSGLIDHAAAYHGSREIVSHMVDGSTHRSNWSEVRGRAMRVANALTSLGVQAGDRVATLAWNTHRHLEMYFGVSGMGAVLHTVNPRLFPEQIAWIANDAQDSVLCFDLNFLPLIEKLSAQLPTIKHYILMCGRSHMPAETSIPNLLCYEELVEAEDGDYAWPQFDENTASSICYTSGTTGHPKGAVYSHRSSLLHAFASAMPDAMDCSAKDVILPVVPMFHVNAWGLPYGAAMSGAPLGSPRPPPPRPSAAREAWWALPGPRPSARPSAHTPGCPLSCQYPKFCITSVSDTGGVPAGAPT